jgi:hypothetical protein
MIRLATHDDERRQHDWWVNFLNENKQNYASHLDHPYSSVLAKYGALYYSSIGRDAGHYYLIEFIQFENDEEASLFLIKYS